MIKQYNIELVQNIIADSVRATRLLFIFQVLSALCAVAFVGWQAITQVKMYNRFFVGMWIILEGIVLVWGHRLWGKGLSEYRIKSWEARQAILNLMQDYSALRYVKFMGVLCNFLGLVGAIKSMRQQGAIEWSAGLCVVCLGLCIAWLREMNSLLEQLKKSIEIYDNFQMDVDGQSEQQNIQEML